MAVIASIGVVDTPLIVAFTERLVDEIPDKPALGPAIVVYYVPVIFESTDTVTHSVGVLAHMIRGRDIWYPSDIYV